MARLYNNANTYPYFKNHMLILSSDHNNGFDKERGTQIMLHKNKYIINDMIKLFVLLGQVGTMFFNGLIGNSQLHFHFHATTEKVPVQEILYNWNKVNYKMLETKKKNKVLIFENDKKKCLNGVLFYGDYKTVGNDIFKFIKMIDKKGLLYNIIFIENKLQNYTKNKISIIVYIRKKVTNEKIKDFNMGATSVGGILLSINP